MSELLNAYDNQSRFQERLLATVSSLILAAYAGSPERAMADEDSRPTVWIEVGGQMEALQGLPDTFVAPFMFKSPTPVPYGGGAFVGLQRDRQTTFGEEGNVTFRPKGSDWLFSIGARYGRVGGKRHVHQQTSGKLLASASGNKIYAPKYARAFADTQFHYSESHTVLDFNAGKDVGIGLIGNYGTSEVSAGIRFAQFSNKSTLAITARPSVEIHYLGALPVFSAWNQYSLSANRTRNFKGVGPSLAWKGSVALFGEPGSSELSLDLGADASVLFGRQKAIVHHKTTAGHVDNKYQSFYVPLYPTRDVPSSRSRSVVIPNLGGTAGISVKYFDAKLSFGYRADFFFGAMDGGIDSARRDNVGFYGPFATVSIGLGG